MTDTPELVLVEYEASPLGDMAPTRKTGKPSVERAKPTPFGKCPACGKNAFLYTVYTATTCHECHDDVAQRAARKPGMNYDVAAEKN